MYEVHDWAEVHRLFHREEWTKTKIAEKLEMSRNTVSRLLELSEPPRYERVPQASKLDPFKGSILGMLKEDAAAPATVIIGHLRREGYDGGITILKEYLRQVRPLFMEVGGSSADYLSPWRDRSYGLVGYESVGAGG